LFLTVEAPVHPRRNYANLLAEIAMNLRDKTTMHPRRNGGDGPGGIARVATVAPFSGGVKS